MADRKLSGLPAPSLSSPCHQNGRIGGTTSKGSPPPHSNGCLEAGPGRLSTSNTSAISQRPPTPSNRISASTSPLRTLAGLVTPVSSPGAEGGSTRPRGHSLGSALSPRTRTMTSRNKRRSSQQEEPEALLDLILECQGQRLEDQRASLSLLPDPGPAALCGACSPDQTSLPGLDFYYMLIHYQSDRMEDQRCSLPSLDDVVGSVPEGQEDFFSLVQRVQSRRMDEQRASLLLTHSEDGHDPHINTHTAGSSPHHHHPHHHH
ncbi:G-protein-signaling modulator 2-like [Epinephelus moara]|uniref:G-protein-signaling modulator 2-like n=1 Tax=Epinephelus moara TaxID=300413 RepID=UPI00214E1005|nr:G-protein-signaling modulator 2-like [Epinephelus moara]XP_049908128.1 G-protein-signaling modulator 2-like [Epinephelus moara]